MSYSPLPTRNWHSNFPSNQQSSIENPQFQTKPCHSHWAGFIMIGDGSRSIRLSLNGAQRAVASLLARAQGTSRAARSLGVNVDCWRPAARITPADSWVNSSRRRIYPEIAQPSSSSLSEGVPRGVYAEEAGPGDSLTDELRGPRNLW